MSDARRRYGCWAGNPTGNPEDLGRCAASVADEFGSAPTRQCQNPRGHGVLSQFCYRHARMIEDRRVVTVGKPPNYRAPGMPPRKPTPPGSRPYGGSDA